MTSTIRKPDPVNCPWITIETPEPKFATQWRVIDFKYEPGAGNTCTIICVDANGKPEGSQYVYQIYPSVDAQDTEGGSPIVLRTLPNGVTDFPIVAIQRGETPGPYCGMVRMTHKDSASQYRDGWSEIFVGVGNHANRHDRYTFTFQRQNTSTPTPPPPVPNQSLEETVKQVASTYPWMPVNNTGALWKFAKANNLQDQQTDEFELQWQGETYVFQVFNLGIVYAKKFQWDDIKIIRK